MPSPDARPHPLEGVDLQARVQRVLDEHVECQRGVLAEVGAPVTALVDAIAALLSGGKRLRAAFLYWGYRAFEGADSPALVRAASAVEVFQAAALLHDDVMDNSDLRRGRPTAHRAFATRHAEAGWAGPSADFGQAAAILAGDLCLNWCDEIFTSSGLPQTQLSKARPVFDLMRTQLMGGQYLDMLHAATDWSALTYDERLRQCRRVIRYKSAKYSVEQPVLIGATALGASDAAVVALSRYGLALGEAFQLRDDLLGVFGDPLATGKPAGDDLREGKRTALLAHALEHGSQREVTLLQSMLGCSELMPDDIAECREALRSSGAVELTEQMIGEQCERARESLGDVPGITDQGSLALADLIEISTTRTT